MIFQRGAVWAEFIIVSSFVLVGLLTLVPIMGKMIDAKHKVEQSGRYAAWERTVWHQSAPSYDPNNVWKKTNQQIQNEIHHRVFSSPNTIVHSRQHLNLENTSYDPVLRFNNRNASSNERYDLLLEKKGTVNNDDNFVQLTQLDNVPPGKLAKANTKIFEALGKFGSFNVNAKGYYKGAVSVEMKELDWFPEYQGLKPVFSTNTALLTDGWSAGGPVDVKARVTPFFPQDWINGPTASLVQDFAGTIFKPLHSSSLKIGDVNSEPVPQSRLTPYNP